MENNFEKQEGMKIPKITKKHLIIGWIMLTVVLVGVIAWQFGWKKIEAGIYQKGFQEGQAQINTMIMQQLQQFGGLQINIPDGEGKVKTIFLVPLQNNSTTTE